MVRPATAEELVPSNSIVCAEAGTVCVDVNAAVGVSAAMVSEFDATPVRPASSVTVRVTVNVPTRWKSCVVSGDVEVFCSPSPKSQKYVTIRRPGVGRLVDALKLTTSPTRGSDGEVVKAAA